MVILVITIIGIPIAILLAIAMVFALIATVLAIILGTFLAYLNGAMYLGPAPSRAAEPRSRDHAASRDHRRRAGHPRAQGPGKHPRSDRRGLRDADRHRARNHGGRLCSWSSRPRDSAR